jgi:hypothetical protein
MIWYDMIWYDMIWYDDMLYCRLETGRKGEFLSEMYLNLKKT